MSQIVVMISLFMGRKVLFERSFYVCVMKELAFYIFIKNVCGACKNITLQSRTVIFVRTQNIKLNLEINGDY